jgi:glyoxylase-like metal-dependent hydrolase (beta-lactamase superfamily II)
MFTACRLAEKIYFIAGEQGAKYPFSHGLYIDADLKVLIDSGFGCRGREAVLSQGNVDVIINTHFHYDHAHGNHFFPQAEIWAHYLDTPALLSAELLLAHTGLDRLNPWISVEKYFPEFMKARRVARELVDGQILDFGGVVLQVIHLPGHTPGHIGFYHPEDGILFSSDIDLSPFGPWYGNVCSNLDLFIASIRKVKALNPRILVTSHSGIITDRIAERLTAFEDAFEERDYQILKALAVEKSLIEPERIIRFFEQVMLEKHLEHLIGQGKVIFTENNCYKAW